MKYGAQDLATLVLVSHSATIAQGVTEVVAQGAARAVSIAAEGAQASGEL